MVTSVLRDRARDQVDIASLAMFRILFGTVMCAGIIRFLATGWIEPMYREPTTFFHYPGFAWVAPWPGVGMYVHYVVLAILALAIALGFYYRIAIVAFTIGFTYTQLIDITNYLNHHYLVVLLGILLALLPANVAWSLDVRRRPELARASIPAWMVWLVRFQVGVVYVFAGLAKAKGDWLFDAQPLSLWLSARTETPLVGGLFVTPWFPYVMAWAGFLFDTTIVAWLSWRRSRALAYAAVLIFHGATGYLFNIGMFPLIMTTAATIFFDPAWPRRWIKRPTPGGAVTTAPPRAAIAIYVALQLALPLRHHVYPGAVLWNEDGMRFAWHVLIRSKHGSITFVAKFSDGKQLEVPPSKYLTGRQEREMAGQPDLILQLARHVADDLIRRGYPPDFTLHARTAVSLNGRPPRPLIDFAVDLREITDLGPRDWVLPGP